MGGGENEITISAILDAVGFEKGTKKLQRAITSLSKTAKGLGDQLRGFGTQAKRSFDGAASSIKRILPMLIGISSVYGILTKAVNAYMSENQKLAAQMNGIWTALGNLIGPIIEQIINWISTAVSYFLEFLRLLGVTSKTASQLSKSAKGAGGDLKKTLAGFDELNILNDNSGGGGANGQLKDVDPADWMKKIAELLKNKMWDEATDLIIEKMNAIIATFRAKAAELGTTVGEWLDDLLHMVARIVNEVNWSGIGSGIGEFLVNAFRDVNGEDIGAILVAKFTIGLKVLTGFLETPGLGATIGRVLSGTIIGAINSITSAISGADWVAIGQNIKGFFEGIDWEGIGDAIFEGLKKAWEAGLDLLRGLLKDEESDEDPPLIKALVNLGDAVKDFCDNVAPVLKDVWDKILKPFGKWLGDQLLPDIINAISGLVRVLGVVIGWLGDKVPPAIKSVVDANTEMLASQYGVSDAVEEARDAVASSAEDMADSAEESSGRLTHSSTTGRDAYVGMAQDISTAAEGMAEATTTAVDEIESELGGGMGSATSGIVEDYTSMSAESLAVLEEMRKGIVDKVKQIKDAVATGLKGVATDVKKNFSSAATDGEEAMTNLKDAVVERFEGIKTTVQESVVNVYENIKTNFQSAKEDAVTAFEAIKSTVSEKFNTAKQNVVSNASAMLNSVRSNFSSMSTAISNTVSAISSRVSTIGTTLANMASTIRNAFVNVINQAWRWGSDLLQNFVNGIYSGINSLVNSLRNVGNTIRSYIGFSEPDKGPLSDFHTFAPDMMDLFVQGIEQNEGKVGKAVGSLAEDISDAMSGDSFGIGKINVDGVDSVMNGFADKIVGGFESMLERLQSIADNVTFTMPAMASGGVVPYGVAGSLGTSEGFGGTDIVAQISSAVYDAVSDALANSTAMNGQRTVVLEVNGREFCRATYNDQQAVAKEHGISLVTNG